MMYVNQITMLYTLNLYSAVCQLYLNKTGQKNKNNVKNKKEGKKGRKKEKERKKESKHMALIARNERV